MRFLVDENLSPLVAELLNAAGHDAIHVRDLGLRSAPDLDVLDRAATEMRVLLSADTDFGELLARSGATAPSVVLLRRPEDRRAAVLSSVLLDNLPTVAADLDAGAIVVVDRNRIRVRRLPLP